MLNDHPLVACEKYVNLLIRINLALGAIFVLGALITGFACHQVLQENAKREIVTEAGLMMDSALAIRDYTEMRPRKTS